MNYVDEARELWYLWAVMIICFGLVRIGLALFEPNAIQMGSVQMPTASSDQLSAYVHWFFWTLLFGQGVIDILLIILTIFLDFPTAARYTILYTCTAQVIFIPVIFLLVWRYRKILSIKLPKINPLKQIRNVLKYTAKHKYPELRSAFTYGELPSRMDLAKQRYGGPFTTEQVEDVKSFLRIFLLLVSLLAFRFQDESGITSNHIRALASPEQMEEYGFNFITIQIFGMSIFVIFVGIPIYQLFVKPLFYRYLTTMLKRMFIGLVLQILCLCTLQVLEGFLAHHIETTYSVDACSYYDNLTLRLIVSNNSTQLPFSYQWVMIPQMLTGLNFLLLFLTVFEFILAQSPYNMQGLLIGIWYSAYTANLAIAVLEQIGCFLGNTGVKALLSLISTIFFVIVAVKYQRRIRDEPTEHNQQQVVEDIFEKYLTQERTVKANETRDEGSLVVITPVT